MRLRRNTKGSEWSEVGVGVVGVVGGLGLLMYVCSLHFDTVLFANLEGHQMVENNVQDVSKNQQKLT